MKFEDWGKLETIRTYSEAYGQVVNEYWKDVPGYRGLVAASTLGRVKRKTKEGAEIANFFYAEFGYPMVSLWGKSWNVHHLVLLAFVGKCPYGQETRHMNGNPKDNRLVNLRWGTHKENMEDKKRHRMQRELRE